MKNLIFTLLFFPFLINAQVYVDQNATGSDNGSSWANAYTDLQDAIQNASSGATLWVAAGSYLPSDNGDVEATFNLPQSISLYGGFDGTEASLEERDVEVNLTVLSGDYNGDDNVVVNTNPLAINYINYGDNARRVVTVGNINGTIVIDGFTISGGHSLTSGAGLLIGSDGELTATVRNCVFKNNLSNGTAGAIRLSAGANEVINFRLIDVVAIHNSCTGGGSKGGVLWATGSGVTYADYINVLFHQNYSSSRGGVISHDLEVHPNYVNCIFSENRAVSGGATFENVSVPSFYRNCTFYKNEASGEASAIHSFNNFGSDDVSLLNCIFYNNGVNPLRSNGSTDFIIKNSIIEYDDLNDFLSDAPGSTDLGGIQYMVDPQFVDADNIDFNLSPNSAAINIGDNSEVEGVHDYTGYIARIVDVTTDLGALEYHLPINAELSSVLCFGEEFGSAFATAENYPPFTYEWSDPSIQGPNPDNLTAGDYELTVTNFIGDFEVFSFTLTESPEIIISFDVTQPTGTNSDGAAEVNVASGVFPFSYEWDTDPVQTTPIASGLAEGFYMVTVTDANGCTTSGTVAVGDPTSVQSIDETNEIEIGPNPFIENVQVILSGSLLEQDALNKVLVYDTSGRLVYSGTIGQGANTSIDLSHLSSGLYFMELAGKDLRFRKRIVKQ